MKAALPFIVLLAVFVLLIGIPMRRQARAQRATQQMQATLSVGDDVMTTSGLFGTIVGLVGDTVELQVAPDVVVRFARAAVGRQQGETGNAADQPAGSDGPDDAGRESTH